jgi:hypothetical protein
VRYARAQLEGRDSKQLAESLQRLRAYVQMLKAVDALDDLKKKK